MVQNGHCTKENYSKMYLMTLLVMRVMEKFYQKETKNYKMPGNDSFVLTQAVLVVVMKKMSMVWKLW